MVESFKAVSRISMAEENKQDALDRKGAFIERMFDKLFAAIREDVKGTIIIVCIGVIIWQQTVITEANTLRIADITNLNEKINAATEKSVERKLTEKLAPIQAKADSSSKAIDTSLLNIDGAVETFKQYIHKNSRKASK